jgi:hypothetical protein
MMEKGSDVPKTLAFTLIILTVLISAASTWVLVTKSIGNEPLLSLNSAIVHLNIFKNNVREPALYDSNAGNARLFIAKKEVS